jgi:hypothetical protein
MVDSVLTIVCALSRFVTFIPVSKTLNSEEVAEAILYDYVIPHCAPLPKVLRSDRDPRWCSEVFTTIAKKLGIRLALSTPYHAQSNGGVETLNNVLGTYLRTCVNAYRDNWPELAPMAALFYNTSGSTALGSRSPAEVRFGYAMQFPFDIPEPGEGDGSDPISKLQERQRIVLQCARDALSEYKDLMIKGSMRGVREMRNLKVGDKVFVSTKAILPKNLHVVNRKTSQRFVGPYVILKEVVPGHAYELKLPPGARAHPVVNISHLKLLKETDEFAGRPDAQEIQEELKLYAVEKILKHHRIKGVYSFRVRWEHYGPEFDTWEPEECFRQEDGSIVNEVFLEYLKQHRIKLE